MESFFPDPVIFSESNWMNPLTILRERIAPVLTDLGVDPRDYLGLVRPSQDPKFGDYQANFCMPLAGKLQRNSRELAAQIAAQLTIGDFCEPPEIAGPGFINLRLSEPWLQKKLRAALAHPRLSVPLAAQPRTYVIDFSSPNVAKPMHVGHIRSTVIGDALSKIIRFLGHQVITDNHLGDWGTQFGMIIYGWKHFRSVVGNPHDSIAHLTGLYRLVRQLVDYHESRATLPQLEKNLSDTTERLQQLRAATLPTDKQAAKEMRKEQEKWTQKLAELQSEREGVQQKISAVETNAPLRQLAQEHSAIEASVLQETAKLHAGDPENIRLWREMLPACRADMQRIYDRLGIEFDHELGESFYHDRLGPVVQSLQAQGLARDSDGAVCVFLEGFETPMIVQKRDGAFLYSTTDLATIEYRVRTWNPDVVLYVVDHRQHEHFEKLFAVARLWGYDQVQLVHVSFGTVLGEDGKPFKTRQGDTVGLELLLDEAEARARSVLAALAGENQETLPADAQKIATAIGIGALKYADLSQNRASDYKFSYDKMLELRGHTATYSQYCFARVMGIFRKANLSLESILATPAEFQLASPVERELALALVRFGETLEEVTLDYRPNLLANYLFDLTQTFFKFYDQCPVLEAPAEELRRSRLQFSALTARTIETGLALLGIDVVDRM